MSNQAWSGRLVAAVVTVVLAATAAAQVPRMEETSDFKGLRERWGPLLAEFDVPGMAVAVVKDGKVHAIETFGVRGPGSGAAPTADTMYYIASITKTYLATGICALADDGKLSLDDPVKKHLPRFALADGAGGAITIRDLLSHKPGIQCAPIVYLDAYTGEITEDRYYKWLGTATARGQVGYSNVHYTVLGRVVEAVSGKGWREYLEERIFKPAGLTRTTGYASRMYGDADCATPMVLEGGTWHGCELKKTDRTMHAAGGLGASAHDAARWLVLHVNDGEIDGKRVISAARAREMRVLNGANEKPSGSLRIIEGYGLGWQVGTFHGAELCSHGGGYIGSSAYYAMLPEQRAGFVILMNAGGAAQGLGDVVAIDILDRLLEGDEKVDVLAAYQKRVAEGRKRGEERTAAREAALAKVGTFTHPTSAYAGKYVNADLGTITVTAAGAQVVVRLGECRLDVTAGEEADQVKVVGPIGENLVLTFVVGKDGKVGEVKAAIPEVGEYVFAR